MNAKDYIGLLKSSAGRSTVLTCRYCGTDTRSVGQMCMCSNCECIVDSSRSAIEKGDHLLIASLDRINGSMGTNNYADAATANDQLVAQKKDPLMMYAAALAYLKYSNYEITQIGYMTPGFMEGNTVHRDKAAKLASSAKRLLAKSIAVSNAAIKEGNSSFGILYARFLAQVKMGMKKGASDSIAMLEKSGNSYVHDYSRMVFESSMERYEKVIAAAEKLMTAESFSVNAFYYAGLALFKTRKLKEAKMVLESLRGMLKSDNLEALIFEVDAQLIS